MNLKKNIVILFLLILLSACVGSSTGGVFGTGVSVALDPRTLGTQIDDSIMQKNLLARLILTEKKYYNFISPCFTKCLCWIFFRWDFWYWSKHCA